MTCSRYKFNLTPTTGSDSQVQPLELVWFVNFNCNYYFALPFTGGLVLVFHFAIAYLVFDSQYLVLN